jgi:O-antigen biosynthesis protein
MMEHFEPAKSLFPGDLERNALLRDIALKSLNQSFTDGNPSRRNKAFNSLFSISARAILKKNPRLKSKLFDFGNRYKKYFPIWFKERIKKVLKIIPGSDHTILGGLYELNISHPFLTNAGFALPTSANPEVSIIIPVHNHVETTLALLQKLRMNDDNTSYEVVVVDDASEDATNEILSRIRGIKVLTQTENIGYLRATNSAIKHCEGSYICLLNNDTLPESGWLDSLIRAMKEDPQVAIAGSMLVSEDGKVAEVGSQIFRNRQIWNLGRWSLRGNNLFNFTREVDYCSAASILVEGSFFRSLGGFDERYVPAYFEDTDLATAAWSMGRKVIYVHDSVVHHIEGVSHGTNTSQGLKAYQEVNRTKFWDKWESSISLPWNLNEVPRYEADRDSKGIIVFVDNFVPSPNSNAGAIRAYEIINMMRELKFHVVVVPDNPEIDVLNRERLRRKGVEIYSSYDEALDNLLLRDHRIHSFWVSRFDVAEKMMPRIHKHFHDKKINFDTVDLHHLRESRNVELNGRKSAVYGDKVKERELAICENASKVIVVTDYEKTYLESQGIDTPVRTLFMPQVSNTSPSSIKKDGYVLFVGNFAHTPNVGAVEWINKLVLPRVVSELNDDFEIRIAGAGLPREILEELDPNRFSYVGWQESLEEVYSKARFVVVPVQYGAGKKGKLGEAILNNCAVISTSIGAEGYPIENEVDYLLADSPVDFAQAIVRLWNDPELAQKLAMSSKEKISRDLSYEKFRENLEVILEAD